jgi:adenosylcobinamide-phosphate synthase
MRDVVRTPVPRPGVPAGRALGLLGGFAADALLGDPRRFHPVAGFGSLATALERRVYAPSRSTGMAYAAMLVSTVVGIGVLLDRSTRSRPWVHVTATAAATWVVLGGHSLRREAHFVRHHLVAGNVTAARRQVTSLVSRDPSRLDADGLARATVESVAENTSDGVVAPLLWGAVAGPAGLLGYRAANTLDAMVGHSSPRYREFGWAAARLDDVVNLAPARVTALLTVAGAPLVGGSARGAARAWRRDARKHPSPNAGPVEAAFAGALGLRLGGPNTYAGVVEDRGWLGSGPSATGRDIARATRLARLVQLEALLVATASAAASRRRRPLSTAALRDRP